MSMTRKWLATLASLTILSGCGTAGMAGRDVGPFGIQDQPQATPGLMPPVLARKLALSSQQQEAIAAITKKYRPEAGSEAKARRAELKAVLLAPTVDADKLTALLQSRTTDRQAMIDRTVSMLAEMRAVLTPEQQAKMASFQSGHRGQGGKDRGAKRDGKRGMGFHPLERMTKGLDLTDAQKQAIDDLKTAFAAQRESRKEMLVDRRKAFADFAASGDQAALKAALGSVQRELPVAAIVKVATSLSQEQRQQIAERMAKGHKGWSGRHHGAKHRS